MNIHEHQAKALLATYGLPVAKGVAIFKPEEAEAAAAVSHPNVMAVLDVDRTPNGLPYLVCEYLEGIDLSEYLKRVGKLDVATVMAAMKKFNIDPSKPNPVTQ